MANNYTREYPKQKRMDEIAAFVVESGTIPSYNTISKRFGISRSTVYALMRELMVTGRLRTKGERCPYENDHLPLRTVSMGKKAYAEKKANSDAANQGGKGGRPSNAADGRI